jgi:hypothetical protein
MPQAMIPVDVTDAPEVLRLAEEVRRSKVPRILRRNGEEIAVLTPVPATRTRWSKAKTEADEEAFLASAGGWRGVIDVVKFIEDLDESRRHFGRIPSLQLHP